MFRPRRDRNAHRFVFWQVGLFFLAAGIWIGGLVSGRSSVTGLSIALLVVAMILGAIGRRRGADDH